MTKLRNLIFGNVIGSLNLVASQGKDVLKYPQKDIQRYDENYWY